MSAYLAARDTDAAADRLARIRARRAGVTFTAMEVTAADVQPGDFIDRVHGAANLRGMVFETAVAEVRRDHNTYRLGRWPIEATWLIPADGAGVAFPSSFRVSIRRPSVRPNTC